MMIVNITRVADERIEAGVIVALDDGDMLDLMRGFAKVLPFDELGLPGLAGKVMVVNGTEEDVRGFIASAYPDEDTSEEHYLYVDGAIRKDEG